MASWEWRSRRCVGAATGACGSVWRHGHRCVWLGLETRPQRPVEDLARAWATYTDGIEAHYAYTYDAVGNMESYTETVDAETTIANRMFDAANQLQMATDAVVGMTQVLLADDGVTQVANLYGLDLISQDDGTGMRLLLADGLGSVRQEMAGGTVETTTTYGPYGTLLAQTGSSGTVYGYTGEQEDAATGLVYLRARYYNPELMAFQSRDPFPGWIGLPASQNGYSYVHGNPMTHT